MQSHGSFLGSHPGQTIASFTEDVPEQPVVFLGIGFGSLVALSAATTVDVDGIIAYDPWWDVDLLEDTDYFQALYDHHHYLYRDPPDDTFTQLRSFESLYPYEYVDAVETPVLAFVGDEPSVPKGASEEMQDLLDVRVVDHHAVSVEQAFIQHMDRVYSFLNEVTL